MSEDLHSDSDKEEEASLQMALKRHIIRVRESAAGLCPQIPILASGSVATGACSSTWGLTEKTCCLNPLGLWYSCFQADRPYHAQSPENETMFLSRVLKSLPWLSECYVEAWPVLQYAQPRFESRLVTQLVKNDPSDGQSASLVSLDGMNHGIGERRENDMSRNGVSWRHGAQSMQTLNSPHPVDLSNGHAFEHSPQITVHSSAAVQVLHPHPHYHHMVIVASDALPPAAVLRHQCVAPPPLRMLSRTPTF
ncbi:hypothetical protein C8Q76DRAFT_697930 [Earliella scabrosa]|nr:hypothetical protein C8Q76DRAFT_697930 [Earliella scabrosa]